MIELRSINEDNLDDILRLKVKHKQRSFVYSIEKSLAKASDDNVFPFAIYNGNIPVGFIMCRYNIKYNSMFIWQLIIDKTYQNRGYGRTSLIKLIKWIDSYRQNIDITTTVTHGNKHAEKLYKSLGFKVIATLDEETDYNLDKHFYNTNILNNTNS